MLRTCGSLNKTKICKDAIGIECNTKKVLCSAEKSSVIWAEPHNSSSAEPNVQFLTPLDITDIENKEMTIVHNN